MVGGNGGKVCTFDCNIKDSEQIPGIGEETVVEKTQ